MGTNRGASQAGSTTFGSRDRSTRQSLLATPTTSYVSRHLCTCQDFLTTTLTSRQPGWPTFITGRTPGQARQDRLLLGRRDRSTRQSLLRTNPTSKSSKLINTFEPIIEVMWELVLPLSVKINDITDDQVMPLKVKNYPIIYEVPFLISVNLRKFRSCSKRS